MTQPTAGPAPDATKPPPIAAHHDTVLVVDFGSQTAQLIARRIRDAGTLAFLVSPDAEIDTIRDYQPKGLVLSGGPASVYDDNAPRCNPHIFDLGVPVLGICYGLQAACRALGATVSRADLHEYGAAQLTLDKQHPILKGVPDHTTVWMSHGDRVDTLSTDFDTLGSTPHCPHAFVRHKSLPFFGTQFHPEVTHTPHGQDILRNFLSDVCRCRGNWSMADFRDEQIELIRRRVRDQRVICGLSGGVDSSVTAALLAEAVGDQLSCVFVDNGLLRKNERDRVEAAFTSAFKVDLHIEDAEAEFLGDLAGVTEPQEKRRRIGHRFIESFTRAAATMERERGPFTFLAQGTLYPDVIESGHGYSGASANIKLHHNVGGLPEELGFDLLEPMRDLFKDEVRTLGAVLGLPDELVWRHPFPGPGLAVRVLGEVTKPRLDILRDADEILLEEIISAGEYRKTAQVFAVLLPVNSVGVMGDARTYESVLAVRAVTTQDFMTADWARLPHELLARISNRIINEVRGVNRVVYDISSKPPATIEWE